MVRPMALKTTPKGAGKKGRAGGQEATASIKVGRDSGRVKVFVRVRPMRPHEYTRKEQIAVEVSELDSQIHVSDPKHSWERDFPFDHVFPTEATNNEVCNTLCKPIVTSALNGFNGTLMAYGQTGSGKTYTLMAPDGITVGVVERCFKRIIEDEKHDYRVSMAYLQIYQEKIYDLLNSTNKVDLNIREHPQKGVYVENLSEFVVRSPAEVLSLMAVGRKRLVFAETKMNRTSSRSHSVLTLMIERTLHKGETSKDCVPRAAARQSSNTRRDSKDQGSPKKIPAERTFDDDTEEESDEDSLSKMAFTDDVLVRGKIHLCDLAGSERLKKTQAEGERLSEAQHINASLLELGNVIHALAENEDKKTHIPFRNSTLTRLLQESLGGNCKTSLVVCVSPCMSDVSETKSTINFGSRAMKITNTAYVNLEVDYKRLSDDLSKLLDAKEKDMDGMKQSYENRIEKIKDEAEARMNATMVEAQVVLASARTLFESQDSSLRAELSEINKELQHEREHSSQLKHQLSSLSSFLQGSVHRTKTALLAEILSMQLFYTIRNLPEKERKKVANEMSSSSYYDGEKVLATKTNILNNTEKTLKLFECYLRLLNNCGETLCENGFHLRSPEGTEIISSSLVNGTSIDGFGSVESLSNILESSDLMLLEDNKTDDDKAVESTLDSEKDENVSSTEKFLRSSKSLRAALMKIKETLDNDAIEFLDNAFGLNVARDERSRQVVYNAIKEFLQNKELDEQVSYNDEIAPLFAQVALLDQSLCHIFVDKALQSALLLLEQSETHEKQEELCTSNSTMNKELQILQIQVQTLNTENAKLSTKLSETSTFLKDVKSSKSRLENDLSSVFQLYNMRPSDVPAKEESRGPSPEIVSGISSLVEENAKLKVELSDCQNQKDELRTQLDVTKEELAKTEMLLLSFRESPSSSASSSRRSSIRSSAEISIEVASSFKNMEDDLGKFLFHVQEELGKIEKTETALAEHSQQKKAISDLRTAMNKRLNEQWKLKIMENMSLRSKVSDLVKVNEEERQKYEKQISGLKKELQIELHTRGSMENKLNGQVNVMAGNLDRQKKEYETRITEIKEKLRAQTQEKMEMENKFQNEIAKLTRDLESQRELNESQIEEMKTELDMESQARLDVENELLQKSKQLVRLDDTLWSSYTDVPYHETGLRASTPDINNSGHAESLKISQSVSYHQTASLTESNVLSQNGNTNCVYEHNNLVTQNGFFNAQDGEIIKKENKELKNSVLELEKELSDSNEIRNNYGKRLVKLQDEKIYLESKLEASEEKCETLESELERATQEQEELETGLHDAIDHNDELVAEISALKTANADLEEELKQMNTFLSSADVEIQLMDQRYNEEARKLDETVESLRQSQDSLNQSKEEFNDLQEAYRRLQADFEDLEESDRESVVEVKLASPVSEVPKSRPRLQSIHLATRAKGQGRKGVASQARKRIAYKINSPRGLETSDTRNNSLKRKSLNKQEASKGSLGRKQTSKISPRHQDARSDSLKKTNSPGPSTNGVTKTKGEENNKLKNELLLAKEQLVRLKAELTVSNVQTTDIGSQLTCLREDSNKLEAELTTMKKAPPDKVTNGMSESEIENPDQRQRITKLESQLMLVLEVKTAIETKLTLSEQQITKLRSQLYKLSESLDRKEEAVRLLNKENSVLKDKVERLEHRMRNETGKTIQRVVSSKEQTKYEDKDRKMVFMDDLLSDRKRLQKEVEELTESRLRYEDLQGCVLQLFNVEDEKRKLERKLQMALKDSSKDLSGGDFDKSDRLKKILDFEQIDPLKEGLRQTLEESSVENTALRSEVDALRIYIGNLENEIKSLKFKLSVSESTHGNVSKKVLGTLLASAKHEREELRETLNEVYSQKEDLEEELGVAKIKCVKLQRELAKVIGEKEKLELKVQSQTSGHSDNGVQNGLVGMLRGFLASIGKEGADDRTCKELILSLITENTKRGYGRPREKSSLHRKKSRSMEHRHGSLTRNAPLLTHYAHVKPRVHTGIVNRSKQAVNVPNTTAMPRDHDPSGQSALRRETPKQARRAPEGMENKQADASTTTDNIDDVTITHSSELLHGEIQIKRSWSIKDLFKRANGKTSGDSLVVKQ